jgi:PIN domain nuclease of toxin-antitoxin system
MKLLLDTHALLWWDSSSRLLSPQVLGRLKDRTNEISISLASVWEIQIKAQIGKLQLTKPIADIVLEQISENGFRLLPISLPHILALEQLPLYHRDPFDRLLLAQALVEGLTLVSADAPLAAYPVPVLW